jgi:hypothetical protein
MMIYRVENSVGAGPYSCEWDEEYASVINVSMNSVGFESHPVPSDDGIYDLSKDEFFGFVSIEQLSAWFPGLVQNLNKLSNWRISTYEVDQRYVKEGESQVAFNRSMARTKGKYVA